MANFDTRIYLLQFLIPALTLVVSEAGRRSQVQRTWADGPFTTWAPSSWRPHLIAVVTLSPTTVETWVEWQFCNHLLSSQIPQLWVAVVLQKECESLLRHFLSSRLGLYNEEELCMEWVIVGCFARAMMLWRGLLALLPFFQSIVMHPEMSQSLVSLYSKVM